MKLALAARVVCDPKHVLASRWIHDTAHAFADALRRAQDDSCRRGKTRKH